jgi:hypothetical protein
MQAIFWGFLSGQTEDLTMRPTDLTMDLTALTMTLMAPLSSGAAADTTSMGTALGMAEPEGAAATAVNTVASEK